MLAGQRPNGNLRAGKGSIYEGGHRVPFLARWGDGTPAGSVIRPGTTCHQLVSVIDWVVSMKDLLGQDVAVDQHYDAVSLLPLLFAADPDQAPPVRTFLYQKTNDEPVIYGVRMNDPEGKWFYRRHRTGSWDQELHDLATDLSQTTNLLAGFGTPADLPGGHPHQARVDAMNSWFLAHDTYGDPRSTSAAYTECTLEVTPEELAPYHGHVIQLRIFKEFANTTHRIAVDDVSLTTAFPVEITAKTPISVPVPPVRLAVADSFPAVTLALSDLHPGVVYTVQRAGDLSGSWPDEWAVQSSQTSTNWLDPSGILPGGSFYRVAYPDRTDTLTLPLN